MYLLSESSVERKQAQESVKRLKLKLWNHQQIHTSSNLDDHGRTSFPGQRKGNASFRWWAVKLRLKLGKEKKETPSRSKKKVGEEGGVDEGARKERQTRA